MTWLTWVYIWLASLAMTALFTALIAAFGGLGAALSFALLFFVGGYWVTRD